MPDAHPRPVNGVYGYRSGAVARSLRRAGGGSRVCTLEGGVSLPPDPPPELCSGISTFPQHPDQHRPERPVLLAVDQRLSPLEEAMVHLAV
jgi:hypothetical protein